MPYHRQLLQISEKLLQRQGGQRGKLPGGQVRRSISSSYYALFHFLLEEAARRIIGSQSGLLRRRRIFIRTFSHSGIKRALDKVRTTNIDPNAAEFLRAPTDAGGESATPRFARTMANTFLDALSKRHDADYDLNKALSGEDARLVQARVERAIESWRSANSPGDRDFKHALCLLMALGGNLRAGS